MKSLLPQVPTKILLSQVQLSPQAVAERSGDLQGAMVWGLKVSSFFISMLMLASLIRFILNSNAK